jgi:L-threonylcarbamoyladenylate synthase
LTPVETRLADRFWPGPLSLIVDAADRIVPEVHAGRRTVAIRIPDEPVSRLLCEVWGSPLTATSANRSGQPPARRVDAIGSLIDDSRVLVIDAGSTPGGAPSTLVDARGAAPQLVRDGAIAWERVLESLQE